MRDEFFKDTFEDGGYTYGIDKNGVTWVILEPSDLSDIPSTTMTFPPSPIEDRIQRAREYVTESNSCLIRKMYLEKLIDLLNEKIIRDYCA